MDDTRVQPAKDFEKRKENAHTCGQARATNPRNEEERGGGGGKKSDRKTERIFETKTRKSLTGTCDSSINGLFATERHEHGS